MAREPKKINSIVIFDFETGGLDPNKNPLMEVAMLAVDGVELQELVRYDNLIKPYDNNLHYDPKALNITGLTKELCEKEGERLAQVAEDMYKFFEEANLHNSKTAKPILVAHNGDFDRKWLQDIGRRANLDWSKVLDGEEDAWGNFQPHVLDSIDWAKQCFAEITENTTKFKLSHLCEKIGIDYVDAHRAMNDVVALADVMRYFIARLRSGSNQVSVSEGKASVHRQGFEWK